MWESQRCSYFFTTAQKMKFSIKDSCSKCDQIGRKLRIWSLLLKKSLNEYLIFCAGQGICKGNIDQKWVKWKVEELKLIFFYFSYDIYHVTPNRRQAMKGAGKVAQVLKVMTHLYHLFFSNSFIWKIWVHHRLKSFCNVLWAVPEIKLSWKIIG